MKLAIIADIHGNLQALEAVLADAQAQGAEIVVNGDLVNRGPNNVAVMERIMAMGVVVTLGNHDDLLRKWIDHDDIPPEWFDDPFWRGTAWSARQLGEAGFIAALRDLPMTHRVAPEGAPTLLISHGSPRHYREGYGQFLTDKDLAEITQSYPADILIGSHIHRTLHRTWGRYQIFNTGAVGTPFNGDPRAQYLLMTLQEGLWRHEFRAVPYDREAALAAFSEMGFLEEGGLSAHIFYEELRYARSFLTPFWMWTEEGGKPRDWASWALFKEAFSERFRAPEVSTTV